MLRSPRGMQATVAVAGLNPQCRYEIFGDTTAVAIIRFWFMHSDNDNTELFPNRDQC